MGRTCGLLNLRLGLALALRLGSNLQLLKLGLVLAVQLGWNLQTIDIVM